MDTCVVSNNDGHSIILALVFYISIYHWLYNVCERERENKGYVLELFPHHLSYDMYVLKELWMKNHKYWTHPSCSCKLNG